MSKFIHLCRCAFWYVYAFGLALLAIFLPVIFGAESWLISVILSLCALAAFEAGLHAKKLGSV